MTQEKTERNNAIERRAREGEPYRSIAVDFDISYQRVQQILRNRGVPPKDQDPGVGPDHPRWKGGRRVRGDGYIEVWVGPYETIPEHRLVAAKNLGRPLREGEVVHHINGDRTDNRWENLEVMANAEHSRLHNKAEEDEYYLSGLRHLADDLGYTPSMAEVNERADFHSQSVVKRFGSYSEACRRAGLEPNKMGVPGHNRGPFAGNNPNP